MKVYIASSWRNCYQVALVKILRGLGCEVYDFRHPKEGVEGFKWDGIDENWRGWTPSQWRDALRHPLAVNGFNLDYSAMQWADICVLVLPSGRSAHMEAGFMAGKGKPVYTLAIEPGDPDLMNLLFGPPDNICVSINELLDKLELPK